MRKKLKRPLVIILLTILIMFCFQSTVFATSPLDSLQDVLGSIGGGIIGILLYLIFLIFALIAAVVQSLLSLVCLGNGAGIVTAEDIIFSGNAVSSGVGMLDVNIFKATTSVAVTDALRQNVATWYYNLRNVAIVASLIVLLYVAIRMAISSVASEKAEYKKMLKDWAVSFVMLFVLHYLIIAIVSINSELVTLIYNIKDNAGMMSGDYMGALWTDALAIWNGAFNGVTSLITYIMLVGTTVSFFILYVKRLLIVSFLIVISPLITITYAIDKMGDGKSQALGTWMKEFVINVIIQPFHCIIYIIFVNAAFAGGSSNTIAGCVFAVLSLLFMHQAENIVKKIFGIEGQASSIGTMAAAGGLAIAGLQNAANAKKKSDKSKSSNVKRKNAASGSGSSGSGSSGSGSSGSSSSGNNSSGNNRPGNNSPGNNTSGNNTSGNNTSGNNSPGSTSSAGDDYDPNTARKSRREMIADSALSTALKGTSKVLKLAVPTTFAMMAMGGTGSVGAGFGLGTAVNSFMGDHKFTRKLIDDKVDKLDLNRQKQKTLKALDEYKNNNQAMTDDELNDNLEKFMDTNVDTIQDTTERKLAEEMQKYGDMYTRMGYEDGSDIALENIIKSSDITKSLNPENIKRAVAQLKSSSYTGDIDLLTDKILKGIDNLGDKYKAGDEYKNSTKIEKRYADQLYKDKMMTDAIRNANNANEINKKIMDIVNQNK